MIVKSVRKNARSQVVGEQDQTNVWSAATLFIKEHVWKIAMHKNGKIIFATF